MKAVVWGGPFDLALKDVPKPTPRDGEVLVKTRVVGICGSDLEVYSGHFPPAVPPMILGHEGGGVVAAVGDGVRSVKPGDSVAVECVLSCGECEYCRRGLTGLCDTGGVLGMRGAQGEYAEYFVAPEKNCYPLPDAIPWPEAGLIDTLAGPVYAMSKIEVPPQAAAAVFGPGPAGLFFCALLKMRGARKVFLVGTRQYRLGYGHEFGADVTIDAAKEDPVEAILDGTGRRGVDIVVEAAGSAKALNEGIRSAKKAGTILVYGVFGEGQVSIDVQPIQLYELLVLGSATVEYPPAIELLASGAVKVKKLITHRFSLEEVAGAFTSGLIEKRGGDYMKGVVLP